VDPDIFQTSSKTVVCVCVLWSEFSFSLALFVRGTLPVQCYPLVYSRGHSPIRNPGTRVVAVVPQPSANLLHQQTAPSADPTKLVYLPKYGPSTNQAQCRVTNDITTMPNCQPMVFAQSGLLGANRGGSKSDVYHCLVSWLMWETCVHVRHLVRRHQERHCCSMCGRAYHKPYLLRLHMYNRHKVKDPSLKVSNCMSWKKFKIHRIVKVLLLLDFTTNTCFLRAGCSPWRPTNSVKALKARLDFTNVFKYFYTVLLYSYSVFK